MSKVKRVSEVSRVPRERLVMTVSPGRLVIQEKTDLSEKTETRVNPVKMDCKLPYRDPNCIIMY